VGNHKLVLESWESHGEPSEWRGFGNHLVHDPPLLFDLSTDLGERHDIAVENPDIIADIQRAIKAYNTDLEK
jgi:hypothetical protein